MLNVSQKFHDASSDSQREIKAILEVTFDNEPLYQQGEASASSSLDATTQPRQLLDGKLRPNDFIGTNFVPGGFGVKSSGWVSHGVSSANGTINEQVTITYPGNVPVTMLWFVSVNGYFPVDFTIDIRRGSAWSRALEVVGNTQEVWVGELPPRTTVNGYRINITKIVTGGNPVKIQEFGIPYRLLLSDDDIQDFSLLEEAGSNADSPIGSVTSNELSISLRNDHKWFTPSNSKSPFKHLLRPGVQLKLFMGVKVASETFEFVPLGTFKSSDWNPPDEALSVSITAHDRIYTLSQEPPAKIPIVKNVTIAYLFALLFRAYGLKPNEYVIDGSLTQPVAIGWIPKGDFLESAQKLAEAGNCSVVVNRQNQIVVQNNLQDAESIGRMDQDDAVINLKNPISFLNTYNSIRVSFKIPSTMKGSDVLTMDDLVLPPGITVLKDVELSGPVERVEFVKLSHPNAVEVVEIKSGAFYADITLNNKTYETLTVKLSVQGTKIDFVSTEFEAKDQIDINKTTLRALTIDNELIQSGEVAKLYGLSLLSLVKDPSANYAAVLRGDVSYELFDVLTLSNSAEFIYEAVISPTQFTINYDGGLEVSMVARKPIAPTKTVFITPYLMVEVKVPISKSIYS